MNGSSKWFDLDSTGVHEKTLFGPTHDRPIEIHAKGQPARHGTLELEPLQTNGSHHEQRYLNNDIGQSNAATFLDNHRIKVFPRGRLKSPSGNRVVRDDRPALPDNPHGDAGNEKANN